MPAGFGTPAATLAASLLGIEAELRGSSRTDAGPGYLVTIAGELTVVGSPVVGAVRMVTAANLPREIVANVFLGERLRDEQDGTYSELSVTATREHRPTKEYPKGQEVYSLTFDQAEDPDSTADGRPTRRRRRPPLEKKTRPEPIS